MFLQSFWKASYINSHADSFCPACVRFLRLLPTSISPIIGPTILLLEMFSVALVRTESDRYDCLAHIPTEKSSLFAFSPLQTGSSSGQYSFSRYPSFLLRKSLLSYSFFNFLFSFYDNTPAPWILHAQCRFKLCLTFFCNRKETLTKL